MSKPVKIVPHLPCHDGHDYRFHGDFVHKDDKTKRVKVWKCARCGSPVELVMNAALEKKVEEVKSPLFPDGQRMFAVEA